MPTPEAVRDRAAALLAEGAEGVHLDFKSQWYDWNCENKKQDFLFDIACPCNGDSKHCQPSGCAAQQAHTRTDMDGATQTRITESVCVSE